MKKESGTPIHPNLIPMNFYTTSLSVAQDCWNACAVQQATPPEKRLSHRPTPDGLMGVHEWSSGT